MKAFITLLSLTFSCLISTAQTAKVDKTLADAKDALSNLGKIFPKKEKKVSPADASKPSTKKSDKLKAGDMAATAKVIDADASGYFNKGVARIKKGTAAAIIDTAGNFIVPFGKYKIGNANDELKLIEQKPKTSGCYLVYDQSAPIGFLNNKGTFIKYEQGGAQISEVYGYFFVENQSKRIAYYMDETGKKYPVKQALQNFNGSTGSTIESNSKSAYRNLNNQIIINAKYDLATPFAEDRAIVGIINEYGQFKYGVIDTKGMEITPMQFSLTPEPYHSGFAKITPADKSEFDYGYLNKQGQIAIKQTRNDVHKYGYFGTFNNGYAFADLPYVMDTTGKIKTLPDFLRSFDAPQQVMIDKSNTQAGKIFFSKNQKVESGNFEVKMYGYIDLINKTVVGPAFSNNDLYFDPVSKLAYAERLIGRDNAGNDVYRKGYINEAGIFVIVLAPKSQF